MPTLPRVTGPVTRAERDALPDDGRRHELVDGTLLVTPAPRPRHQLVQMGLIRVLLPACPSGLRLLAAPVDVLLATDTVLQPDLLVVRDSEVETARIETVPQLVVEILSHSSRLTDLSLKKAVYESAGVPAYWTVDPDRPSITVWELRDGAYAEAGAAEGDGECVVARPFAVRIVPRRLLGG